MGTNHIRMYMQHYLSEFSENSKYVQNTFFKAKRIRSGPKRLSQTYPFTIERSYAWGNKFVHVLFFIATNPHRHSVRNAQGKVDNQVRKRLATPMGSYTP